MNDFRKITLIMALTLLSAGTIYYALRPREPEYQGKQLSIWLEEFDRWNGNTNAPVVWPLRRMGTNALPKLREMLRSEDSRFKKQLMKLAEKQSLVKFRFTPVSQRRRRAMYGCQALGPLAKAAIPELIELLKDKDASPFALDALIAIGPETLPLLTEALANNNEGIRCYAAMALGLLGSKAPDAIPALIKSLKDKDLLVRCYAAKSLGQLGKEADLVVPVLIENLSDPNPNIRRYNAQALGAFGVRAKAAVPSLLKTLDDQTKIVRLNAAIALKQIDPEAAAKAGVK